MRSPESDDSNNTPVRIGRAPSPEAAIVTWPIASANASPSISVPSATTSGWAGKSSVLSGRSEKRGPFPWISTSVPVAPSVTMPAGILRTASDRRRPGITALPSSRTSTSASVRIVTSRSVPVTRRVFPATSQRRPWRTGKAVLAPTARLARARTSARSSRWARILTGCCPFLFCCSSSFQIISRSRAWGNVDDEAQVQLGRLVSAVESVVEKTGELCGPRWTTSHGVERLPPFLRSCVN